MNIKLNNEQINRLQSKSKLYSYLTGSFDKTTFVAGNNKFLFRLSGDNGILETTVEAETSNDDTVIFSMDYNKWQTLIQKFSIYNTVNIDVTENGFTISTDESSDHGAYNINITDDSYDIESMINVVTSNGRTFEVTDEIMSDFELMNSMFSFQSDGNSIGVKNDSVIYADGSIVIKTRLTDNISEQFFENLAEDEDTVFVGSDVIKLMSLVYRDNPEFTFSCNYEDIYWHNENTKFIYKGDLKKSELPSDEEFDGFKPENPDRFSITAKEFKDILNFFNGVYEGSEWKPLTFITSSTNGLTVKYSSQTTNLSKHIDNVNCNVDTEFILSSDTIKNIVSKINDRLGPNTEINVDYNDDESSLGVYITAEDIYQAVLVKLGED